MRKVQWGVLSTARIGMEKVIPAMQRSGLCQVGAIASRSLESARKAARALGIPRAYGSYEELLADPGVEAVYNPLPNHLHVPYTLKAAEAGKHVLCEKPMALDLADLARLEAVSPDVLVMEAFMVRFHPQWLKARAWIQEGRLGELRAVQAFFSYRGLEPGDIRNRPDWGGGALYDIGCYAVVAGRFFLGSDPVRAIALVDRDPAFGVDRTTSGLVDFGAGRHLDFTVSTHCVPYQRVQICGTLGRLELLIPFNAPARRRTRILFDDGSGIRTETLPACDQYTLQGEAFSRAVLGEIALPYGIDDARMNVRVLEALFRSEKSQAWEAIRA
ncbi:MAG TPA: Gfo/Idh/MocA family oxidoreductase [Holophaga sp.]|nr:Gfo/Idh/MocA family oxidoreductase [Holophaga sp.]